MNTSIRLKPKTVDEYLEFGCGRCELGGTPNCKVETWRTILCDVRAIVAATELEEQIKWGCPCYTIDGSIVLMLSAYKESVVVSFFRGNELSDPRGILEMPGKHSQYARYLRFTDVNSATEQESLLLEFIQQAITLERSGAKQTQQHTPAPAYPDELVHTFSQDSEYQQAFEALTPGRKRGYLIYFTDAKKSETRTNRINKLRSKVLLGKGHQER